ncbi:MAG: hypothetical protein ACYTGQ_05710 [Planctomycetota bacterium]
MLIARTSFEWATPWEELRFDLLGYLLMALSLLLLGRLLWVWRIRVFRWMEPWRLYARVSRELGLSVADRWRLWRVARREGLCSPITLLLSEATLRHHAERYLDGMGARNAEVERRQVEALSERLFGG